MGTVRGSAAYAQFENPKFNSSKAAKKNRGNGAANCFVFISRPFHFLQAWIDCTSNGIHQEIFLTHLLTTLCRRCYCLDDAALMKRLADAAPAAHSEKVRKPLLVIAGGKDQMVEIAAVTDYVARLQGSGKPVSLLVDPDEGHQPRKPIMRQAYVYLLQRMLHPHLGGPAVAAPSAELAKFLGQTMKANGALAL